MNILKKTNGIDLRAKGTALQGHVKIQLKDDTTGRIVEEVEHKNFFTKALDSALNGCPFGLNNLLMMGSGASANDDAYKVKNIYQTLLGGIICFPESLGEGVDDYYPPFDTNYPTAYASMASYPITDSKQGTFDGVSSGVLENGYKFVYNWGSTAGNGQIGSVALSNSNCFTYFNNPQEMLFPKYTNGSSNAGRGFFGNISDRNNRGLIAMSDDGVLLANNYTDNCVADYYPLSPYNVPLTYKTSSINPDERSPKWSMNIEPEAREVPSWQFYEGEFWCIEKPTAGASQAIIRRYAESDGTLNQSTIAWSAPDMVDSRQHFALKDGYLYAGSTTGGKIYKCSLTNPADASEIECNSGARESLYTNENTDNIYGRNIIINNGVVINTSAPNVNVSDGYHNGGNKILYNRGVWIITAPSVSYPFISAQMIGNYCATKANLDSPVTKSNEKQMVINYSVTQV